MTPIIILALVGLIAMLAYLGYFAWFSRREILTPTAYGFGARLARRTAGMSVTRSL
jgi:hypothetical protein